MKYVDLIGQLVDQIDLKVTPVPDPDVIHAPGTADDEELAYEYFVQVFRKLQKELADKNNEEE